VSRRFQARAEENLAQPFVGIFSSHHAFFFEKREQKEAIGIIMFSPIPGKCARTVRHFFHREHIIGAWLKNL
jgi:hypothetical protein